MKALAWITPSIHPGQPKRTSYATQKLFLIRKECFTREARLGTVSD